MFQKLIEGVMHKDPTDSDLRHLEMLRELTNALPPFPPALETMKGVKFHKMECGTSISIDLLSIEGVISVARWFNSNGAKFPIHSHPQREWLIVFEGSMFYREHPSDPAIAVEMPPERRLVVGQHVCVAPNTRHSARYLEDCQYLAITIPSNPEWPR